MSFLNEPLSLISIKPSRKIGEIDVNVIINESAADTLTITKQPVQQGASITDHAFKEPTGFSTTIMYRDNLTLSLSKLYQQFLDLQVSGVPFDIITPKRIYRSMLLASIGQTTDKNTENCLALNLTFQEIIIVKVTTHVPRQKQLYPQTTGKIESGGRKSALASFSEAVKSLFSGGK